METDRIPWLCYFQKGQNIPGGITGRNRSACSSICSIKRLIEWIGALLCTISIERLIRFLLV
ncbi:hypothetical protein ACFSO7_02320 [Bacillus sp. CGMCC 1.16607]|uniref:hypothetical protein n=1 Tax=Bacillus sp. CGMCC 1.16607 TaxID=3351842 RepID=UPI0036374EBD